MKILLSLLFATSVFATTKEVHLVIGAYYCPQAKYSNECKPVFIGQKYIDVDLETGGIYTAKDTFNDLDHTLKFDFSKYNATQPDGSSRVQYSASTELSVTKVTQFNIGGDRNVYGMKASASAILNEDSIKTFHSFSASSSDFLKTTADDDGKRYLLPIAFINFNNPYSK